jgi:hypothetical protein
MQYQSLIKNKPKKSQECDEAKRTRFNWSMVWFPPINLWNAPKRGRVDKRT